MSAQYTYNIHNIVTLESEVDLPELARFLIEDQVSYPMMRVRIAQPGMDDKPAIPSAGDTRFTRYDEGFGRFGFAADIEIGDRIEVVASPILRRSPHVLYTNLVEPILRWRFVELGYVLVHGACIAYGDQAYLVTARTDTGKTTTVLRILDKQRRLSDRGAFISDDLTILAPDGTVMNYPKPLTISYHTVKAVNSPLLSWYERLALVWQSRIHSRSGRRFAFLLTKTGLPMATLNTLAQLVVPPPKYHVRRLVPTAKLARAAKLAGMFVIERGGNGETELNGDEAVDILLSNCEDAYGFPPYHDIESFLNRPNGSDLRPIERDIVASALAGRPAVLLRSSKLDWGQRIQAKVNQRLGTGNVDTSRSTLPAGMAVVQSA